MTTITPINPQVIFVSATTPSDITEGKLWYNTTNNLTYVSDGSSYGLVADFDLGFLTNQQLAQDLNILINSIASSSTLNDYDDMFVDIFSDEDGADDTIDTGNTTALFLTNNYTNNNSVIDITETPFEKNSDWTDTIRSGIKITTNENPVFLKSGTIMSQTGSTATQCYLCDADKNIILSTGITANFNYMLEANTSYYLMMDKNGDSYDAMLDTTDVSFPYEYDDLSIINSFGAGSDRSFGINYEGLTYVPLKDRAFLIVQTNIQTITENPLGHQVYCHNSITGAGTITYNISFDGGTTWIENQAINTKNTSIHAGSSMIIKLNLNGDTTADTATAYNYGVMLFY